MLSNTLLYYLYIYLGAHYYEKINYKVFIYFGSNTPQQGGSYAIDIYLYTNVEGRLRGCGSTTIHFFNNDLPYFDYDFNVFLWLE